MANEKSSSPVTIVLLLLVSLNVVLTAVLLARVGSTATTAEETRGLPSYLDDAALAALATSVTEPFNAGDATTLYELLDPVGRVQVTEAQMAASIVQLRQLVGYVSDVAYTGHDKSTYGDYPAYTLYYRARYREGGTESGTVKLSVIDRGDHIGIVGFIMGSN